MSVSKPNEDAGASDVKQTKATESSANKTKTEPSKKGDPDAAKNVKKRKSATPDKSSGSKSQKTMTKDEKKKDGSSKKPGPKQQDPKKKAPNKTDGPRMSLKGKGGTAAGTTPATKTVRKAGTLTKTDEIEEWQSRKQLIKPADQLELTDNELKEPIPRQLLTLNPQLPINLVEFNYALGEFCPVTIPTNVLLVYQAEGSQIHKSTDEAKQQLIEEGIDPKTIEEELEEEEEEERQIDFENLDGEGEGEEEGEFGEDELRDEEDMGEGEGEGREEDQVEADDDEGKEGDEEGGKQPSGKAKKLTNQFNFCERAALTYINPTRCIETQTVPPPQIIFSGNVLQWVIYDAYQQDYEAQQLEKKLEAEKREAGKTPVGRQQVVKKHVSKTQLSEAVTGRVFECWRVLERMVNQNTYNDIAMDYRYWEDPSDEFREQEGTLLPLWKFCYDKTKKHTVTDITWNPYYYDMFGVCFGSLDFMKPMADGCVCLFTIKNPSFPDYICWTESPAICCDIHPKFPYMVAVGLYDGTVLVFNVSVTCKKPAYQSDNVVNKHRGIVWEIKWAPDLPDGELNFYSVSSDGKINNWVLMQNEFSVTHMLSLYMTRDPVIGPDGTKIKIKGCVSCIKFHPSNPLIYLVGTEIGEIYKCSTAYSTITLLIYPAHNMPVYRIDFNKFNSDIFISCSGDWKVKIWEDNRLEPLFVFDLGAFVGDVKWAPYSSTVFAAVTSEGKCFVFDLNVNKYRPICVQAIVSKKNNKCTRLSFNNKLPVIVVGDERGSISTLKLSPNLRIPCKAPKKQQHLDQWTLQCMKLDKILSLVREPVELLLPEDTAGSEIS